MEQGVECVNRSDDDPVTVEEQCIRRKEKGNAREGRTFPVFRIKCDEGKTGTFPKSNAAKKKKKKKRMLVVYIDASMFEKKTVNIM